MRICKSRLQRLRDWQAIATTKLDPEPATGAGATISYGWSIMNLAALRQTQIFNATQGGVLAEETWGALLGWEVVSSGIPHEKLLRPSQSSWEGPGPAMKTGYLIYWHKHFPLLFSPLLPRPR